MKKRATALCLSLCLMFSAIPFAVAAEETETLDSSKAITAQHPDFIVTPKMNDMKDRITIDVKADKEGTFLLRRTRDNKTWTNIGGTRKISAGENMTWEGLAVKDYDGSEFRYQIVSLDSVGKSSLAVTVEKDKQGFFGTRTEVIDMMLEEKEKDNKSEVSDGDDNKPEKKDEEVQSSTLDKKPETDTTAKKPDEVATVPQNTISPGTGRPNTANVTTKANSTKPAVKSSSSSTKTKTKPTNKKAVPKTGVTYGLTAMAPWILLGSGIVLRYRRPKMK